MARRADVLAALSLVDGTATLESDQVVYDDVLTKVTDLARLRAGMATGPRELVFAANEVATNAFEHGRPPVSVRLYRGAGGWSCVITDRGHGTVDPYAGVDSPLSGNPAPGGHGLWLARQLCDSLTIVADPGGRGTTVRLERHA